MTVLVAFDAGARTERPEENGMAHFLEHLVFKGGEKYDDYRKVNETAERMGARAQRLHVATTSSPSTSPAAPRSAPEAIDLLTDFVGRPKIDAEELDRERGVVIQEIARANDQPSVVAEHLIDRAAFGDHPLGPPGARARGAPAHVHARRRSWPSATRRWAGARGGAFLVGNLEHVPDDGDAGRAVRALPVDLGRTARTSRRRRSSRSTLVEERDSNQSHLRMSYRPTIDSRDPRAARRADVYSTLLGGSMGSRLFDEIREQRGLAYSVYAVDHAFADVPILQLSAGPGVRQVRRGLHAHARDRRRAARRRARPRRRSSAPARTPPAAACWRSRTPTRSPATRRRQTVVFGEEIDPDAAIAALDEATFDEVDDDRARASPSELSVACVGPHEISELRVTGSTRAGVPA